MQCKTFYSLLVKKELDYHVYLPEEYENSSQAYPTIYAFYDSDSIVTVLNRLKNISKEKDISPFIMVFIDIGKLKNNNLINSSQMEEDIFIREFIQLIDKKYRTIDSCEGRAVEGYMEGGFFALKLAFKYYTLFRSVICYGEDDKRDLANKLCYLAKKHEDKIRGKLRIRIVKAKDNNGNQVSSSVHHCLDSLRIPHQFMLLKDIQANFNSLYNLVGTEGWHFHKDAFEFSGMEDMVKPEENTVLISNLEYKCLDNKPLLLDLYLPTDIKGELPVIIWIHGGGWMLHSKEYYVPVQMVSKGYAVASINYRLSYQAKFPAQLEDCKSAVRWLRANAVKYHLDVERFGVWGNSAGGHLAALVGTTGNRREFDKGNHLQYSSSVQAVCDYYGPIDFLKSNHPDAKLDHNSVDSAETKLLGEPAKINPDKAIFANPLNYITNKVPPFMIVHGDKDEIVHYSQSIMLYDALKNAGIEAVLHILKGAPHGFELGDMDITEVNEVVGDFFDKNLKTREIELQ